MTKRIDRARRGPGLPPSRLTPSGVVEDGKEVTLRQVTDGSPGCAWGCPGAQLGRERAELAGPGSRRLPLPVSAAPKAPSRPRRLPPVAVARKGHGREKGGWDDVDCLRRIGGSEARSSSRLQGGSGVAAESRKSPFCATDGGCPLRRRSVAVPRGEP